VAEGDSGAGCGASDGDCAGRTGGRAGDCACADALKTAIAAQIKNATMPRNAAIVAAGFRFSLERAKADWFDVSRSRRLKDPAVLS
jgi:hypothetical protein